MPFHILQHNSIYKVEVVIPLIHDDSYIMHE